VIELRNISLDFDKPILTNISLQIKQGETLGILGRSGAGKSSLLAIIAGKLTPQSGDLFYQGKILPTANQLLIPGFPFVQIVEQNFALDLYHTVYENIHVKAAHLAFEKRDSWVRKIMRILGLTSLENQKAISLSGGEQQRLAIGRALASKPTILLLDEPFAHLDEVLKSKLVANLAKLKSEVNCTIVVVSHDGTDLLSISDTIVHLKKGHLSRKRTPEEIYFTPKNKEEAELFGFWNRIEMNEQLVYFRPSQYNIVEENGITLESITSFFKGSYFENHCKSKVGNFVLHSFNPLITGIQIVLQK
jgi:iron(III) transport system ATP-binding protein